MHWVLRSPRRKRSSPRNRKRRSSRRRTSRGYHVDRRRQREKTSNRLEISRTPAAQAHFAFIGKDLLVLRQPYQPPGSYEQSGESHESTKLTSSASGPLLAKSMNPSIGYLRTLQLVRMWLDMRLQEASEGKTGPESILSWRKEFLREFEETDAKERPLANLPVVVVSSGPVASDAERRSRDGAASRSDFVSSNTMHVTASPSGHEIHLYQPDRAIQALIQTVSAVRNRAPLI